MTMRLSRSTPVSGLQLARQAPPTPRRFYLDIYALPMVLEGPALVRAYFPSFANADTELPYS